MARLAMTAAFVLMLTATMQPADAILFGVLDRFFQPFPVVGVRTYAAPTQIGTAYINKFPFTTPPAPDCLQRALGLLNGCQPFLNALNANGGQLGKLTILQILQLAIQDKTADLTHHLVQMVLNAAICERRCYNAVASFLNGGCICDNGLIATINVLNTVPAFAKQALINLNRQKCPFSPPPPPVSPFPTAASVAGAGTPPGATTMPAIAGTPPAATTPPVASAPPVSVNMGVGASPSPSDSPLAGGRRLFNAPASDV